MNISKINGNTNVILAPTNIGIYTFKSKLCILIDTGNNNTFARKIDSILVEQGLKPKYIINTHHHSDHTGGNKYFISEYPGVEVYTSQICKLFLENEELDSAILFGGNPLKELNSTHLNSKVDLILEDGIIKINDEKFQVITLKGHAQSGIGIITPDRVCFVGDSIFSSEILDKYSFPFLYNVKDTLETLEKLKEIDCDLFVIGHSKNIINKEEFLFLINKNIKNIENYIDQILELLNQPITKEDLMQNIIILNELSINLKQYFLNLSSISAFLTYLENKGLITYYLEEGKIYYYIK